MLRMFKRLLARLVGGEFTEVQPTMRELFKLPKEIR